MDAAGARGMELLGGRWRRPILDAGVTRGGCEALVRGPASAVRVARALAGEAGLRARRLRALGSWGRWREDQARTVALTPRGERRCRDHPRTRRGITRRLEGPEHDAAWKHRPALSTAGPPHAVGRACGPPPVDAAVPPPARPGWGGTPWHPTTSLASPLAATGAAATARPWAASWSRLPTGRGPAWRGPGGSHRPNGWGPARGAWEPGAPTGRGTCSKRSLRPRPLWCSASCRTGTTRRVARCARPCPAPRPRPAGG